MKFYSDDRRKKATIRKNALGEFVVRFYGPDENGEWARNARSDYFTDDRNDAIDTATFEMSR